MSFHEDELLKIQKATSGPIGKSARKAVSKTLLDTKTQINNVKMLDPSKQKDALIVLLNEATHRRHAALAEGANSHGDPKWAAAAASESWLTTLITQEGDVEELVYQLIENQAPTGCELSHPSSGPGLLGQALGALGKALGAGLVGSLLFFLASFAFGANNQLAFDASFWGFWAFAIVSLFLGAKAKAKR